ncbi:hypothetical protein AB6A40_006372 [Gnathostoma spinigerum]|uniref:Uncharacterized protein n=1 Tax=Gnathostoma spinigerum TaxID=75299 RepID=A0ABD6ERN5_9BILA
MQEFVIRWHIISLSKYNQWTQLGSVEFCRFSDALIDYCDRRSKCNCHFRWSSASPSIALPLADIKVDEKQSHVESRSTKQMNSTGIQTENLPIDSMEYENVETVVATRLMLIGMGISLMIIIIFLIVLAVMRILYKQREMDAEAENSVESPVAHENQRVKGGKNSSESHDFRPSELLFRGQQDDHSKSHAVCPYESSDSYESDSNQIWPDEFIGKPKTSVNRKSIIDRGLQGILQSLFRKKRTEPGIHCHFPNDLP